MHRDYYNLFALLPVEVMVSRSTFGSESSRYIAMIVMSQQALRPRPHREQESERETLIHYKQWRWPHWQRADNDEKTFLAQDRSVRMSDITDMLLYYLP